MDVELLITAVKKRPCIWNARIKEYHNRNSKDIAWKKIFQELYQDWGNIKNKRKKRSQLKRKWNNIRNYYQKGFQKNKNSCNRSTLHRKYFYADLLTFLQPIFEGVNSEVHDIGNKSAKDSREYLQEELQEDIQHLTDLEDTITKIKEPVDAKKRKKYVPTKRSKNHPLHTNADDVKFLLSFVSDMARMTLRQKIDFKIQMFYVLKLTFDKPAQDDHSNSSNHSSIPNNSSFIYDPSIIPSLQSSALISRLAPLRNEYSIAEFLHDNK